MKLKVHSGKCCLCDVGIPVRANDSEGKELHTGDIVCVYSGHYIGTDLEQWIIVNPLTVVVSDQYQSFSDGSVVANANHEPFVMGIKDCGFSDKEWSIRLVKKFSDVVDGEHWPAYGFSYHANSAADGAAKESQ